MDLEKNIPTSLAILELVEDITNTIDGCKSTVGVFIDLKKEIYIRPLTQWIIIIQANKWVCSYNYISKIEVNISTIPILNG